MGSPIPKTRSEPANSEPADSEPACTQQVNVHQAKSQLSRLLHDVEAGREVVIARSGVPIARLVPWRPPSQGVAPPGALAGEITLTDDFDHPLEELFGSLAT